MVLLEAISEHAILFGNRPFKLRDMTKEQLKKLFMVMIEAINNTPGGNDKGSVMEMAKMRMMEMLKEDDKTSDAYIGVSKEDFLRHAMKAVKMWYDYSKSQGDRKPFTKPATKPSKRAGVSATMNGNVSSALSRIESCMQSLDNLRMDRQGSPVVSEAAARQQSLIQEKETKINELREEARKMAEQLAECKRQSQKVEDELKKASSGGISSYVPSFLGGGSS